MRVKHGFAAFAVLLLLAAQQIYAEAPTIVKPGLQVLTPPGEWVEVWFGGGEGAPLNVIGAKNEFYGFEATLQSVETLSDGGEWMYKTTYVSGKLTLRNKPGAPWYNKKVPVDTEFLFTGITVKNLTWKDLDAGLIKFALVGTGDNGKVFISGGYEGPIQLLPSAPSGIYGELDYAAVKIHPLAACTIIEPPAPPSKP